MYHFKLKTWQGFDSALTSFSLSFLLPILKFSTSSVHLASRRLFTFQALVLLFVYCVTLVT